MRENQAQDSDDDPRKQKPSKAVDDRDVAQPAETIVPESQPTESGSHESNSTLDTVSTTPSDATWARHQTLQAALTGPKRFGDYELISEIARGGMGVVYRARQVKLNRVVALKMILSGQLASENDVRRFYIEAEAAANLEHPGIIPIYEVGEHEGQHFFSMKLVEGISLAERLQEGPLPPREAARITWKLCEAMAYAHQRNVIHRDLKPANVLLDTDGQPKVTDFGLAKKTELADGLTATGQILGTPSYMPPEQASGQLDRVDVRSDVYSLGAILYSLLTGRSPFQTCNVFDTLKQVIEQDPVPPRRLNSTIHQDLEIICLKCLSKSPEKRYASADQLGADLDRFLMGEPIQAKASTVLSRTWSMVLSETRYTEVMAMWSRVWWWHAGLCFILFALTGVLQWYEVTPLAILALWIPGFVGMLMVVWYFRFRAETHLLPVEKQVAQVWATFGVTAVLTAVTNRLMQLELANLWPIVALESGLAFCCMAAILGGSFYPLGFACFLLAVVLSILPDVASPLLGILIVIGLLIPARKYGKSRPFVSN